MAAILKWMFVLVLLIAVLGGGAAYWLYLRSDEGLRLAVLRQLRTMAPDLKFDIVSTQFDFSGRVRIYGLTVYLPDDQPDQPSLDVPELIVTLESPAMTEFEMVIQKLFVVKPKVSIVRDEQGAWNWRQAVFQTMGGTTLPDIEIENAAVQVEFQLPHESSRRFDFQDFNVTAHPADAKRYLIQIATQLNQMKRTGALTLEVDAALDGSTWRCESRDPWRIPINQSLVQLLCDLSPEVGAKVAQAGEWMENAKAMKAAATVVNGSAAYVPFQTVSRSITDPVIPNFGARCLCDLSFRCQKDAGQQTPTYKVLADISRGEIDNPLLPFPFHDLKGKVYADNGQIIVSDVQAANGPTQISLDAGVLPDQPISGTFKIRDVEVNEAIKARLPEALRRIIESLGVTGTCDIDFKVTQDGGTWDKQIDLRLKKGSITAKWFPVTVRGVSGELHLKQNIAKFDATGTYAGQPVNAYGTITDVGKAQRADIVVKSQNLPIDDESLSACPATVQKAIEALRLKGRYDLLLRINRPAGELSKYDPELNLKVYDASLSFKGFPYDVKQLTGFVKWKGDTVEFNDLSGTHDAATLTGRGLFRLEPKPKPGRLELAIDATDASFDRSLEAALPRTLRQVWNQFQPQGQFDVKTKLTWVPDQPCEVILPSVKVRDGEVLMSFFPWPLHGLNGEFSYNTEPGKLVMKRIVAQHDDAQFIAAGSGSFPPDQPWQLEFNQLSVGILFPNATLRNALPPALQSAFDFLQPSGAFSFRGPIQFAGPRYGDKSISASWDLTTVLSRCALNAGTRIEEINGEVKLAGQWDGKNTNLDANLDIDSLLIFRQASGQAYQISKISGPLSYHDNKLVLGSEAAIPPRKSNKIDVQKRIVGNVIDGTIFLDAAIELGNEASYRAFVELMEARLETYAQQYLHGKSKLAGAMNGWINVRGRGVSADRMTGEGKLVIAPASLYEMPLFAQMFRMLQMQSPDRTAFDQADVNFTVKNSRFDFDSIELLGDALSMRGRGFVRFDGAMQLDFGMKLRQMIPNPFSSGLVAVKVTGNVGDPKTTFVPLPQIEDGFRQFLGAFDWRRMTPRNNVFSPRTGQLPDEPNR